MLNTTINKKLVIMNRKYLFDDRIKIRVPIEDED
jgi:hypothetical protein